MKRKPTKKPPHVVPPGHLTSYQAAVRLNMSYELLKKRIREGFIPAVKIRGRYYIKLESIASYIRNEPYRKQAAAEGRELMRKLLERKSGG